MRWGAVPYWWGTWSTISVTPMVYFLDNANNDVYRADITPSLGLYEYTAYCQDATDTTAYWQSSGNGRLVVGAAGGSCEGATG